VISKFGPTAQDITNAINKENADKVKRLIQEGIETKTEEFRKIKEQIEIKQQEMGEIKQKQEAWNNAYKAYEEKCKSDRARDITQKRAYMKFQNSYRGNAFDPCKPGIFRNNCETDHICMKVNDTITGFSDGLCIPNDMKRHYTKFPKYNHCKNTEDDFGKTPVNAQNPAILRGSRPRNAYHESNTTGQ
jgi:hypothetical protein